MFCHMARRRATAEPGRRPAWARSEIMDNGERRDRDRDRDREQREREREIDNRERERGREREREIERDREARPSFALHGPLEPCH